MQEAKIEASPRNRTGDIPARQKRRRPRKRNNRTREGPSQECMCAEKFEMKFNVYFLLYFIDHFKGLKFVDHFGIIRMMKMNSYSRLP